MKKYFIFIPLLFLGIILPWKSVFAFCGFYVAKADASLYNEVSRVVFVRNEDKTVLTLMNDYKGKLKDFALVVPVPVILKKEQIHIGDSKVVDHLDAFTAPRLVEYFDENPCYREYLEEEKAMVMDGAPSGGSKNKDNKGSGVTVEASYTVGEYDIVILSAKYSNGLENWLRSNKYKIPKGASKALAPYIKQKMKFFVAKVNLKNQANTGLQFLRPLQFAFNSEKFMLPIRLGMINANGPQELLVYMISKNGRVETSNYRNVKIPSDMEIPLYVKNDFANFYKSMFNNQARKENRKVTFTEYFWDMSWCDPCAAEPLSREELSSLGVFWLNEGNKGGGVNALVTRIHVQYTNETFPEDLMFTETSDRSNFQGRYILRHPWKGSPNECSEAREYFKNYNRMEETRAKNLANLTGWDINKIRSKINLKELKEDNTPWWKKVWK